MFGFRLGSKSQSAFAARVPDGMRVYAVGDIHGRRDLLDQIHAKIVEDFQQRSDRLSGQIVYLGDYVDRGDDSAGVLETLSQHPLTSVSPIFLRGNHEAMLEEFLTNPQGGASWRHLGGLTTLFSYRIDVNLVMRDQGYVGLSDALARQMPDSHREFLAELRLSHTIGDYFFCHAGVRPGVPLDQQRLEDLLWIREEFMCSDHEFGKVIVHGHTPIETATTAGTKINVDTGAYLTGRLTCLVLEGDTRRLLST